MKTKKYRIFLAPLFLVTGIAGAQSCGIENARDVKLGVHQGIEGTCSNNGLKVICTYETSRRLKCVGPDGSYSGDDADTVIFSACGCGKD